MLQNSFFVKHLDSFDQNNNLRNYVLRMHLLGNCYMGGDFHWYRLDNNGTWSHKPGQTGATNLDDASRTITDPRTADTGVYKFVCFMIIIKIVPVHNLGN